MKKLQVGFAVLLVAVAVGLVSVADAKTSAPRSMPAKVNKVNVVKPQMPKPQATMPKAKVSAPKTVKPVAPKKTSR